MHGSLQSQNGIPGSAFGGPRMTDISNPEAIRRVPDEHTAGRSPTTDPIRLFLCPWCILLADKAMALKDPLINPEQYVYPRCLFASQGALAQAGWWPVKSVQRSYRGQTPWAQLVDSDKAGYLCCKRLSRARLVQAAQPARRRATRTADFPDESCHLLKGSIRGSLTQTLNSVARDHQCAGFRLCPRRSR